jgi:4-hydroxy-tetrahydrodipicolinate reductase
MSSKSNVMIHGISGRMGVEIKSIFEHDCPKSFELIGGSSSQTSDDELLSLLSDTEVIIDFSQPEASKKLFRQIKEHGIKDKKVLLCTTGLSTDDLKYIKDITKSQSLTTLRAANTSLGVLALYKSATKLASSLFGHGFDIEIVETHHKRKKDAPSGTAKFLGEGIAEATGAQTVIGHPENDQRAENSIGMHAVRGGGVYGEHEIRFISEFEELTISHRALSRSLFARGSIILAGFIRKKTSGFYEYGDLELSDL